MSISDAEMAQIEKNWNEFEGLCKQLDEPRQSKVLQMLEALGERAAIAPASSRLEFHNAFPGGFIDHSLRVLEHTIKLAAAFKVKASKESLIIAALFHDLGKLGTVQKEYYLPQTSDWHRDKLGQMYVKNPDVSMPNAQLGLFVLSQFEITLSEDEYLAILLNDGMYAEENRPYSMKEPKLALLVHWADRWSSQLEKGRKSVLDPAK